ncbi:MAG TPA: hypothetical protein PLL69_04285 [Gemmatimonadales bacterium]|nr:hypothetical protein [Gemmatimonadales bacterium]
MHIELTDHLRCPADHDEAFLVLIPERMDGRQVVAGHLGCPVCGWACGWSDEVPAFDQAPYSAGRPPFDAEAAIALLGINGPGGWLALAGRAGALAHALAALLPGVRMVAVNPPEGVQSNDVVSVIRSSIWPIKRHSMRGVLLGEGDDNKDEAAGSVLPGLRAVGEGDPPGRTDGEIVASAPGIWVVRV